MSFITTACSTDWLHIVVEYLGFTPWRFYLASTCKTLFRAIPREVFLSAHEFVNACLQKAVNPKLLCQRPEAFHNKKDLDMFGEIIHEVNQPTALMTLLERSFCRWAIVDLAAHVPDNDLRMIQWDAWSRRSDWVFQTASAARRCAGVSESNVRRIPLEFPDFGLYIKGASVELLQRLLIDWDLPSSDSDWHRFICKVGIASNCPEPVEWLIDRVGWDLSRFSVEDCAQWGHMNLVQKRLDSLSQDESPRWEHIRDALHGAVRSEDSALIEFLVRRAISLFGPHPVRPTYGWFTYLSILFQGKDEPDLSLTRELLAAGVDVNSSAPDYRPTCLDSALMKGFWKSAELLIAHGATIYRIKEVLCEGPLGRNLDQFNHLVVRPGLLNRCMNEKIARALSHPNVCQAVAEQIIDLLWPQLMNTAFAHCLETSVRDHSFRRTVPLLKRMLARFPTLGSTVFCDLTWDSDSRSEEGLYPAGICALYKPKPLRKWDGKPSDSDEGTLLDYIEFGDEPFAGLHTIDDWDEADVDDRDLEALKDLRETLIECKTDMNRWATRGCFTAVLRDAADVSEGMERLLSHGSHIDAVFNGNTEMSQRALEGDPDLCEILMTDYGAKIFGDSIPNAFVAAAGAHENSVEVLEWIYSVVKKRKGFSINSICSFRGDGLGALHWACMSGNADAVRFLLNNKADVELRSSVLGLTPLMCAFIRVRSENDEEWQGLKSFAQPVSSFPVVTLLLNAGVDINARDLYGRSLLFNACLAGCSEVFEFLVERGAAIDLMDENGVRPIDLVEFIEEWDGGYVDSVRPYVFHRMGFENGFTVHNGYEQILDRLKQMMGDVPREPLRWSAHEMGKKFGFV